MRKVLATIALCSLAAAQAPQRTTYNNNGSGYSQGATIQVPNAAGSQAASFEYLYSATPASASITIQGCMRGANPNPGAVGTCDAATDTYTGTSNSIRSPSFTKVYDTFLITVGTLSGATLTVNTTVVVSKAGTGSGSSGPTGTGTTNVIAKWTAATVLGNSAVTDNGTTVTSTEQYVGPLLTGPTYSMVGQTAQGFGDDATIWGPGAPTIWLGSNSRGMVVFNGITIPGTSGSAYGFANIINSNSSITAKLSQPSSGVISFDTSSAGNGLGSSTNCRTVVNVTPVTVNANVSTDQNLMAFTLPANCLNTVGRTLRIFVAGVYSTAAASTAQMTLKIKLCSVSGCGSGNVASVISIQSAALGTLTITNNAWNGTFYVATQTASTAGAWEAHGAFGIDEGALATAADSFFNDSNTATVTGSPSAIDTTAQNFLQITFAFSAASASNAATQRQLVIDSVN